MWCSAWYNTKRFYNKRLLLVHAELQNYAQRPDEVISHMKLLFWILWNIDPSPISDEDAWMEDMRAIAYLSISDCITFFIDTYENQFFFIRKYA